MPDLCYGGAGLGNAKFLVKYCKANHNFQNVYTGKNRFILSFT